MAPAGLGLLGLGARSRALVVGSGGVRAALQRDGVALVVTASDRSERTREKVERLAVAKGIPCVRGPAAAELGRRIGRRVPIQAVGVRDRRLAEGIVGATQAKVEEERSD